MGNFRVFRGSVLGRSLCLGGALSGLSACTLPSATATPSKEVTERFAKALTDMKIVAAEPAQNPSAPLVPSSTPTPGATVYNNYVYVSNGAQNNVSAFKLNPDTGVLTTVGHYAAGTFPYGIAVDPKGHFVFASNIGSSNISAYKITAATGALTLVNTIPCNGDSPAHIAMSPNGNFVYTSHVGTIGNTVSAFHIDPISGDLSRVQTIATGNYPHSVVISPNGKFAYTANYLGDSLSAFTANADTGALSAISAVVGGRAGDVMPLAPGSNPRIVTVHPNGIFLYVILESRDFIDSFRIDQVTGALTPLTDAFGKPLETPIGIAGTGAVGGGLIFEPSGAYLYETNRDPNNNVSQYSVDSATGKLSFVKTFKAGGNAVNIAIGPKNATAFVANPGTGSLAPSISTFKMDPVTGDWTFLKAIISGSNPVPNDSNGAPLTAQPYFIGIAAVPTN